MSLVPPVNNYGRRGLSGIQTFCFHAVTVFNNIPRYENSFILIPFITVFALSVAVTVEAGSPGQSPGEVTLQNNAGQPVKLMGVEFGRDRILVTLQNTGDKDIAKLCVDVHFSDSRGPYIWSGTPTPGHGKDYDPCLHNLGAHSVLKISLTPNADDADDLKDFKQVLSTKKEYLIAGLLISREEFKDNSTAGHQQ